MSEEQPIHYWDRISAYTPCYELPHPPWVEHTTDKLEKVTCPKCKGKIKGCRA